MESLNPDSNEVVRERCISRADARAKRIGDVGFFRDQFQSTLSARSVALLQGFQTSPPGRPKATTQRWGADAAGVLGAP